MGPSVLPAIAIAATVASTAVSIQEGRKQRAAQQEQAAQAEASNAAAAASERRSQVRAARRQQAAAEAAAIQGGTTGSSALLATQQGAVGAVSDSAAKTSGELLSLSNASAQNQIIAASQRRQQTFASIANFAQSVNTSFGEQSRTS